MGGKAAGGGGMGGGGKGRGGGAPVDADVANQTRRQNIYTTVGGLSRPNAASGAPPSPRVRPSGPGGPPASSAASGPLAAPGSKRPTPRPTPPGLGVSPTAGPPIRGDLPEGMAAPSLASIFAPAAGGAGVFAPAGAAGKEFPPLDAEAERRRRVQQQLMGMGGNATGRSY